MIDINEIINMCEWFPSNFLVISENVFSPLLYYSYFFALIPTFMIGFFIFLKDNKKIENKLLFLMIISFSIWVFSNLVTWATEFPKYTMFFWTLLILFEPIVYFFALYLSHSFIFKKDFSIKQKLYFFVPLLPILILGPTKFGLLGYDLSNCDRAAIEGLYPLYGFALEIIYLLLIVHFAFKAFSMPELKPRRKEITIFAIGISLFLFSFSLGNIAEVFSENWYIGQYGLFGAPIFAALLAYLIVKFKTFNIKLIAPQVLVFSLIFLNIAMLFVRSIENIRYVLIPTIIVSSVVSWILIRSVKQVDNQRELLDLANKEQENLIHFISHQVKGFFTKSRNIFDTLNSEPDSIDETLRPLIAEGLRSDNEGITVVTNILNAANLKTGKVNYISNKLYLNTLLDKIIEKEKPLAEKKGLQLIYNSDGKLLEFSGDEIRLQDAILNIIQNAINYTEKGSITVTLSRDDIAKKIRITINDTGVGLTDSDKSKLFKSGSRGADSLKYNVNSTGYGLFIAKQVIEKHGGTITANSEGRDMGSTFVIELPLK